MLLRRHALGVMPITSRNTRGVVCLVAKTAGYRNLRQRHLRPQHQSLGAFNSPTTDVVSHRCAKSCLKCSSKIAGTQPSLFRTILQSDLCLQRRVDEFGDLARLPGRKTAS